MGLPRTLKINFYVAVRRADTQTYGLPRLAEQHPATQIAHRAAQQRAGAAGADTLATAMGRLQAMSLGLFQQAALIIGNRLLMTAGKTQAHLTQADIGA
jgi:hypothetical protein